jgi:hypothetical protein
VTAELDVTPPDAPTIETANEKEISGTAPGDDVKEVVITYPTDEGDKKVTCPVVDGKFSCQTPKDATDGTIKVVAKDEAGNGSVEVTAELDVTGPVAPGVAQHNDTLVNATPGDATPGDRIVITWGDGSQTETTVDEDGNWWLVIPDSCVNGCRAEVVAVDPAGNVSEATVITVHQVLKLDVDEIVVETDQDTPVDVPVLDFVSGGTGDARIHSVTDPAEGGQLSAVDAPLVKGFGVVTVDTKYLIYTPSSGFVGEDTFLVTITDGIFTVDAPVRVKVNAVVPTPCGEPGSADDDCEPTPTPTTTTKVKTGGSLVTSSLPWIAGLLGTAGLACLALIVIGRRRRHGTAN